MWGQDQQVIEVTVPQVVADGRLVPALSEQLSDGVPEVCQPTSRFTKLL
jgi:hypothetical protein